MFFIFFCTHILCFICWSEIQACCHHGTLLTIFQKSISFNSDWTNFFFRTIWQWSMFLFFRRTTCIWQWSIFLFFRRTIWQWSMFLAHLAFRPSELLPSLFVRRLSTFHILIFDEIVIGWFSSKNMFGGSALRPKWLPPPNLA